MHGFGTVSQRSKAFPFGFVAKKDRGKGFSVWAVQEMEQEPKRKEAGRGRGRKEAFLPHPVTALFLASFFAWSLTLGPCSLLRNRT